MLVACTPASIAVADPPARGPQDDVEEFARQMRIPGIAARLVDARGPQWEVTTGLDGRDDKLTTSTPFVWGSVSKSAAAAIATGLAESDRLDLDTAVREVLPEGATWVDSDVTVNDLIHHISGLPHDVSLTDVPRSQSAREVVTTTKSPEHGSKGAFRYSSLNYLLLQAVIEQVTGDAYTRVVEREIGTPSGARITADTPQFTAVVPAGYVPWFGTPRSTNLEADGAGFGYGYLAGSIESLGRYAQWLARSPSLRDSRITAVQTSENASYGPGLYLEQIAGRDVWWHSGAVPGYFTHIALFPDTGQALVLASNRYGELESNEFAAFARYLMCKTAGDQLAAPPATPAAKLPVLAAVIGISFIVVGAFGVWRMSRRCKSSPRRKTIAVGVFGASFYVALGSAAWFAHLLIGVPSTVLSRWTPDIAFVLTALSTTTFVIAVAMTIGTIRCAAPTKNRIT
ncbi:serine hydrolase domain-containing protein [Tsukamurella strandjordii]|uniref:Serine hydrolase domain-containing protein n=1 Tax=Tsukamurella strandjordii TaxID=147577 RepID=A0AA90NCX1_9ACTN|nr:serine hydrolase domain-containing protein [Tsukamurella strandjordii]MDP0400187.1 serine hydrolase domain-containing protein [Tsukamurella strandjordii]